MKKSYYLTYDQRLTISRMIERGFDFPVIANLIGIHISTLYRELQRGQTVNGAYDASVAQSRFSESMKQRGRKATSA